MATNIAGFIGRKLILRLALLALLGLGAVGVAAYLRSGEEEDQLGASFDAFRGTMEIAVLEGGSVEAKDSLQLQCEVQGTTRILSLVEEGYLVTPQDVEQGLVLIELDSKELVDKQLSQELEFQSSVAALTEAIEQYEIQLNQNESNIKAAELEVHFMRMDLEKYLGVDLAVKLLEEQGLTNANEENILEKRDVTAIDFGQYAQPDKLGDGEARQKLRQLENSLELSAQDLGLAENKLEGTKRLFEREFVMKTQLETDESGYNRKLIERQSAETSRDLFIKYEFPKAAQKLLSDYEESLRKLVRAKKLATSTIAQSEAKKNSAEVRHQLQTRKRDELTTQIEKCTIRAPKPGLVVYGSGEQNWHDNENIEEGATVRERQVLLTIPDTSVMAVRVQVHESFVKKVRPGQKARIRVDAYPNEQLSGTVHRIAVLPDSQNRWLSPDLKVYSTIIHIEGEYGWLKPGMSAEAEIVTDVIEDALQVPVNAVHVVDGKTVCYVTGLFGMEPRIVKTGEYNISFIEIKEGLEAGESVLLRAPQSASGEKEGEKPGEEQGGEGPSEEKRGKKAPGEAAGEAPPPSGGGGE